MTPLFEKLQFKDQDPIYVAGAPPELREELEAMEAFTTIESSVRSKKRYGFALFFVYSCADIAKAAPKAVAKIEDDGILWFAYPKKSSKRYASDIGRDDGWQPLGDAGFEGVRQVAVDEDWSALRFRRSEHIRSMKRDPKRALSAAGKARSGKA